MVAASARTSALPEAPLLRQMSLREYQRRAIEKTRRYVSVFRQGKTKGAALVHMATGTGKTGVIASLARCTPEIGGVLVLAPRIALCEQLELYIRERFFEHLKRKPKSIPKRVVRIEELIGDKTRSDWKNMVIVATIQMIESMSRLRSNFTRRQLTKRKFIEQLRREIDLVLVDEGHYEPALSWSTALRQFAVPRVLFTATPYRNDLKTFDVDFGWASHYTLSEATQQNIIRQIRVVERQPTRDPEKFIEDVLAFYDSKVKSRWPDARVIIRCDNRASIDQMAAVLVDKRRTLVAIHDKFQDSGGQDYERRSVPSREEDKKYYGPDGPVFWVHQFKLLEGIDDDRFRLVAIFEPLRNDRQVVQQIGRVIRNPESPEESESFVLDHSRGHHRRAWTTLFAYDDDLAKKIRQSAQEYNNETATQPGYQEFVRRVLAAHEERAYVLGRARNRFSFDAFDPAEDLRLPLATNLLQRATNFNLDKFVSGLKRRLEEADRVVERYKIDETTMVLLYVSVTNAPFLESTYFLDGAPGVIVASELSKLVAFYDSSAASPLGLPGIRRAARPEFLRKLISGRKGSKLVEMAMKNAQLGHRAVRMRSVSAASMDETVPALDDHVQVLTRVTGYSVEAVPSWEESIETEKTRRRYLGFRHGRVVESSDRVDLQDYRAWLDELEHVVTGDRRRLATFSRYASDVSEISDPTPRNVLVDVYEVLESYKTLANKSEGIRPNLPLQIEDLCQDVVKRAGPNGGSGHLFWLEANGRKCEVEIKWDPARRRYGLLSRELDRMYVPNRDIGSLTSYLNREQSFRVLPEDDRVIYVDGEFYELMVPVGSRFDVDRYHVGRILEPLSRLRELKDEKGENCLPDASDWDPESLFGFISRGITGTNQISAALGQPDIVVCDDLGTEVADFVVSQKDRVAFLHAKGIGRSAQSPAGYSAGKLTYVCGQAIKNIRYLSMFNDLKPKNLERWNEGEPWSSPDTKGYVRSRILKKPRNLKGGDEIWKELQRRIENPRTNREVWLVLGGILSKSRLERELSKSTSEAVQAVTLLHGTLAAVGSIDAKLRVFCYP